ncbi:MAG: L-histidine N(alpha)-methyltransferase [Chlorobi bacterium]|nr:L-histidine N(alpha)-methyltransferase [Chlorobiota bacterium]
MDYSTKDTTVCGSSTIVNHLPEIGLQKAVSEIVDGLLACPKRMSCKYFYDTEGSKLFNEITRLPEYYPARTEKEILRKLPLKNLIGSGDIDITELGSGNHAKITIILDRLSSEQLSHIRYLPVDISRSSLETSIRAITGRFPGLSIQGITADYYHQMHLIPGERKKLLCFLGSTIGNLDRDDAMSFVRNIAESMQPGDGFLIGFDRLKSAALLESAYNDRQGLTARFNKNILCVVNRLMQSDFDPEDFEHRAFYNPEQRRIEMHLEAKRAVHVKCPSMAIPLDLQKGETIHTENSHKFDVNDIQTVGEHAGLSLYRIFSDKNEWFSLAYYKKMS